jgi:putative FmdB family regulatory protein
MPAYDYDCASCGRRFEVVHGIHADPPAACPLCGGGPIRKAVTAPAVHYKGTGWAKKERRPAPAKAGSSNAASGESGPADAKDGATSPVATGDGAKAGSSTGGGGGGDRAATTKPAAD